MTSLDNLYGWMRVHQAKSLLGLDAHRLTW